MSKRVFPTAVEDWSAFTPQSLRERDAIRLDPLNESTHVSDRPETELEALMRAAPGDTPKTSVLELQELREAVAECIDRLEPRERFIVEALYFERISQRALAERLGYRPGTHTRLVRKARQSLVRELLRHPVIRERLGMSDIPITPAAPTSWNEAVRHCIDRLTPTDSGINENSYRNVIERQIDLVRHVINERQDPKLLRTPIQTLGVCAAELIALQGRWDIDRLVGLLCRKQHDYGNDNILAFNHIGIGVRLSDKVARYFNLLNRGSLGEAEPLDDALDDMVGYAAVDEMLWLGWFELPLDISFLSRQEVQTQKGDEAA